MDFATLVDGNNRFAFGLYQRLRAGDANLFFSPASISTALGMAYAGASGETATEMAKALHFELPMKQLNEAMRALQESWKAEGNKGYRLDVANRLWVQQGYQLLPEYLAVTRTDYGAEAAQLDMNGQPEQARQTINNWILDQTQQKIANLISSPAVLTNARLVLTNAVYFKGNWTDPFNKSLTKSEDFHVSPARTVKAPLMHARRHFRYAAGDGLQFLELPYGDRSLSLIALLPERVDGLADLETQLSLDNLKKWSASAASQEVIVYLPRFKTTSEFLLGSPLGAMGMSLAFNSAKADFSGMSANKDLFIGAVIHKAYVDVNEEGTEAAAATGVVMRAAAARIERPTPPPVFRADHPFVFLIRDNRNGSILFLGRVVEPPSS